MCARHAIAAGNKNFVMTRQAEEERTFYKSFTIFLAVFLQVSSARTRGALVGVWGLGEGHRSRLLPLHSRACPVSEASGEIYHAPMQKKARHSRLSKASILASDVVEPSASSITGHARWKSCRFYIYEEPRPMTHPALHRAVRSFVSPSSYPCDISPENLSSGYLSRTRR